MLFSVPQSSWSLSQFSDQTLRDHLAQFWLSAPADQLQQLWAGTLGETTRSLIQQLTPATVFSPEQISLRETIGKHLQTRFDDPLTPQFLLAVFLFSPPGLFRIGNPDSQLPSWLADVYKDLYENTSLGAQSAPDAQVSLASNDLPRPDFGEFPDSVEALCQNRIQLNRMLGLSNLYYIDPEDREITDELIELRYKFVEALERCPETDLERFWSTDLGDRYWALVRSGVQKEPLTQRDEMKKSMAIARLQPSQGGGFGTPGAINSLLIAMVYFVPGSMKIDDAKEKLPVWLYPNFEQIFLQALPS